MSIHILMEEIMNLQIGKFVRAGMIVLMVSIIILASKVFTLEHGVTLLEKPISP